LWVEFLELEVGDLTVPSHVSLFEELTNDQFVTGVGRCRLNGHVYEGVHFVLYWLRSRLFDAEHSTQVLLVWLADRFLIIPEPPGHLIW
jgi:hypothetical protein